MKIGELSRKTGCNIETIRYYEKIGLLPKPDRSDGNYRIYVNSDIKALKFILKARFLGFSLEQVRELQKLSEMKTLSSCDEVKNIASSNLELIDVKINDLNQLKTQIDVLLSCCKNNVQPSCPLIDNLFE